MIVFTPVEVQRMLLWKQKADIADSLAIKVPKLMERIELQGQLIQAKDSYILDLEAQYKKVFEQADANRLQLTIYRYSTFTLLGITGALLLTR
jgi:hypothetical protein